MPKYLWRPYTRAIKNLRQYEEDEQRLIELSGCDIDKLIELFAAGYTLKPPEPSGTLVDILREYDQEPTFATDENGQLKIVEVSLVRKE